MADIHLRTLQYVAASVAARFPWMRVRTVVGEHGEDVAAVRATLISRPSGSLNLDLAMLGIEGWIVTPSVTGSMPSLLVDKPVSLPVGLTPSPEQLAEAFGELILTTIRQAEKTGVVPAGTAASADRRPVPPSASRDPLPAKPAWNPLSTWAFGVSFLPLLIPSPSAAIVVAALTLVLGLSATYVVVMREQRSQPLAIAGIIVSTFALILAIVALTLRTSG